MKSTTLATVVLWLFSFGSMITQIVLYIKVNVMKANVSEFSAL